MKTVLMLVTEERMLNMVQWLLDTGSEDDGMTRVSKNGSPLLQGARQYPR